MSARGWRHHALEWFGAAGGLPLIRQLRPRLGAPSLTVLAYHRVFDPPADYPFDRGVIDVTPAAFARQLRLLRSHFSVIDLERFRAHVAEGAPLPTAPALVTFDDGYLDNLTRALPILRRHGVPATLFVATDYVEQRRLFWWDRLHFLFNRRRRDMLELSHPLPLRFDLRRGADNAYRTLATMIKEQYGLDHELLLQQVGASLGVSWGPDRERELADELLLGWDDLRRLQRQGFTVQSHTCSHRTLQTLHLTDLRRELTRSRAAIERALGTEVFALSYPVGRPLRELPVISQAMVDAGYQLGFTNDTGLQPLGPALDPLDLNRIAAEPGCSPAYFKGQLALPQLAASRG